MLGNPSQRLENKEKDGNRFANSHFNVSKIWLSIIVKHCIMIQEIFARIVQKEGL